MMTPVPKVYSACPGAGPHGIIMVEMPAGGRMGGGGMAPGNGTRPVIAGAEGRARGLDLVKGALLGIAGVTVLGMF